MRAIGAFLVVPLTLIPTNVFAQKEQSTAGALPQKAPQQFTVEDGGTREVLESIVIPPKAEAPFTLTLETEWVKALFDGGTITLVNKRRIARDSSGRIYQERWLLVPKNGKAESVMNVIQISDPSAHTHYNCFVSQEPHVCVLTRFAPSTSTVYKELTPPTGELPDAMGSAVHEQLGKQFLAGVETTGVRDSIVYNPGVFGNNRKMSVEREYWYSPQLGINMLSIRSDPRFGKQTFTATNLILADPDPKLFELPEGDRVDDRRSSSPPEVN
jgi:hypothetical protein